MTAEEARESIRTDKRPMALEELVSFCRGVFFATVALKKRFGAWGRSGREAFKEVSAYQTMVRRYRKALEETVKLKREEV